MPKFCSSLVQLFKHYKLLLPFILATTFSLILSWEAPESAAVRWTLVGLFGICVLPILWTGIKFLIWSFAQTFKSKEYRLSLLVSTAVWVLVFFAFPPMPLGFLMPVLLIPWFWAMERLPLRQALGVSFISALAYNAVSYYWITSVVQVKNVPKIFVFSGLALLVLYLSFYNVLGAWFYKKLQKTKWIYLFPLFWAGIEVFRGTGEITFPWSHLGYTSGFWLPWMQLSAWIGAFGLSIVLVLLNILIWKSASKKQWKLLGVALGIMVLWSAQGLFALNQEDPSDKPAKIAVMQPSIQQQNKWKEEKRDSIVDLNFKLLKRVEAEKPDLVVFPETALPGALRMFGMERYRLRKWAYQNNIEVLIGVLKYEELPPEKAPDTTQRYWTIRNGAIFVQPMERETPFYTKNLLVPFSEQRPWANVFPMLNYVKVGGVGFTAGTEQPIWGKKFKWSPTICYETIYPAHIRKILNQAAEILVQMTNDAWFGRSPATYQHLNIVRMRAVENGIPVARSANTGVSAYFDARGRQFGTTELFKTDLRVHTLQAGSLGTIYSKIGDFFESLLLWFMILGALFLLYRSVPKEKL